MRSFRSSSIDGSGGTTYQPPVIHQNSARNQAPSTVPVRIRATSHHDDLKRRVLDPIVVPDSPHDYDDLIAQDDYGIDPDVVEFGKIVMAWWENESMVSPAAFIDRRSMIDDKRFIANALQQLNEEAEKEGVNEPPGSPEHANALSMYKATLIVLWTMSDKEDKSIASLRLGTNKDAPKRQRSTDIVATVASTLNSVVEMTPGNEAPDVLQAEICLREKAIRPSLLRAALGCIQRGEYSRPVHETQELARRVLKEMRFADREVHGRFDRLGPKQIARQLATRTLLNGIREGFGARYLAYVLAQGSMLSIVHASGGELPAWAVPVELSAVAGLHIWACVHIDRAMSDDYRLRPSRFFNALRIGALVLPFLLPVTVGVVAAATQDASLIEAAELLAQFMLVSAVGRSLRSFLNQLTRSDATGGFALVRSDYSGIGAEDAHLDNALQDAYFAISSLILVSAGPQLASDWLEHLSHEVASYPDAFRAAASANLLPAINVMIEGALSDLSKLTMALWWPTLYLLRLSGQHRGNTRAIGDEASSRVVLEGGILDPISGVAQVAQHQKMWKLWSTALTVFAFTNGALGRARNRYVTAMRATREYVDNNLNPAGLLPLVAKGVVQFAWMIRGSAQAPTGNEPVELSEYSRFDAYEGDKAEESSIDVSSSSDDEEGDSGSRSYV